MQRLNYHHLYYFWRVALAGKLTEAAQDLRVSQSALSLQIRQLEVDLGDDLFARKGRNLILTEFGNKVLAYAQDIFAKGEELESMLRKGFKTHTEHLSIGVAANLSRNFVEGFIAPLLKIPNASFTLSTRSLSQLLSGLESHELDLALTNTAIHSDSSQSHWQSHLVGRQRLAIVGPHSSLIDSPFPLGYENTRWILPSKKTELRSAFDAYCARFPFYPEVQAEADDMAMLRLLARDSGSLAVLPPVVVKDEIEQKLLAEYQTLPNSFEHFYAITIERKFVKPLLLELLRKNTITT